MFQLIARESESSEFPYSVMDGVSFAAEIEHRVHRESALQTIRRIVMSDRVLRAIKARLWRPDGRLVQRMLAGGE